MYGQGLGGATAPLAPPLPTALLWLSLKHISCVKEWKCKNTLWMFRMVNQTWVLYYFALMSSSVFITNYGGLRGICLNWHRKWKFCIEIISTLWCPANVLYYRVFRKSNLWLWRNVHKITIHFIYNSLASTVHVQCHIKIYAPMWTTKLGKIWKHNNSFVTSRWKFPYKLVMLTKYWFARLTPSNNEM